MCKFVQWEIHLKKVGQDFHFFEAHTSSVIIAIMCYTPAPLPLTPSGNAVSFVSIQVESTSHICI